MGYRCVHCNLTYGNTAPELTTGCSCGSKFFFYIKDDKLAELERENPVELLTKKEKEQMEEDVREISGIINEETPVFLDFESITTVKPGKYLIDLSKLFSNDKPRVYKLEDGKYIIDFSLKNIKKGKDGKGK
jgi:predicted  nucleic acid-binding Zn-ribbon protein